MDNVSTSVRKKKKSRNKTKIETKQLGSSIERKTPGCNWETYKKAKSEESNGEKIASQNRHPKPKNILANPLQTTLPEQSNKHIAVKNKENKALIKLQTLPDQSNKHNAVKNKENKTLTKLQTLPEQSNNQIAVKNKENKALTKHIAMDCEMVGIGDGTESMIARVSIVNRHGNCIYDKYVKPREKVVDYRTAVSGIRPEDLQDGEDFNIVQKEVADILKGRVLVGHALKHDLSVLYLSHPRRLWRDTSRYKPFRQTTKGNTPSLKKLAHELLGKEIQVGEHSSVEDARTAMHLYMLYKGKWESERKGRWLQICTIVQLMKASSSYIKVKLIFMNFIYKLYI
nr:PREDICTED: RNA exonuclease 4 isoform X2 [Linepithema humile]XP_012229346.1 PREDICTED: RNA exonuclease 4 isoform X2 [Linepithema humile]XP_012229347.1 PREDICTED: RNA exonuclease 4 isoform X2 [Linepithema humile]